MMSSLTRLCSTVLQRTALLAGYQLIDEYRLALEGQEASANASVSLQDLAELRAGEHRTDGRLSRQDVTLLCTV